MKEEPRGHGKTVETAILMAWHGGRDTTLCQKIVGSNDTEAIKTAKFIRREIESDLYQEVFPWAAIDPHETAAEAFRYAKSGGGRDPSYEARGIFSRAGGRADRIWGDDLADLRNAILQPSFRTLVKEAWKNTWLPMLNVGGGQPERLSVWVTGTPWHIDDFNMEQRAKHAAAGTLLRLPCVGLVSPWPEAFTPEVLAEFRRDLGPTGYARAFELVPLSDDMLVFRPDWLLSRLWKTLPRVAMRTIGAVDWAYGTKAASKADPDWSVFQVAQVDANGDAYGVELLRMREPMPVFKRAVAAMSERLGVTTVYAEGGGPQEGVVQELRECCKAPVVGLSRSTDKHFRATEVQSYVEQGKYHLPMGDDGQVRQDFRPVFDEMVGFPASSHDDALDTAIDICRQSMIGGGGGSGVAVVKGGDGRMFVPRPLQMPGVVR